MKAYTNILYKVKKDHREKCCYGDGAHFIKITEIDKDGDFEDYEVFDKDMKGIGSCCFCFSRDSLEGEVSRPTFILNTNNPTSMTSIKTLFKKEPQKSFIQAGLMNENEDLTQLGKDALEHVLWQANEAALVKIANELIPKPKK